MIHATDVTLGEMTGQSGLELVALHACWGPGFRQNRCATEGVAARLGIRLRLIDVDRRPQPDIPGLPHFRLLRDGDLIGSDTAVFRCPSPTTGKSPAGP